MVEAGHRPDLCGAVGVAGGRPRPRGVDRGAPMWTDAEAGCARAPAPTAAAAAAAGPRGPPGREGGGVPLDPKKGSSTGRFPWTPGASPGPQTRTIHAPPPTLTQGDRWGRGVSGQRAASVPGPGGECPWPTPRGGAKGCCPAGTSRGRQRGRGPCIWASRLRTGHDRRGGGTCLAVGETGGRGSDGECCDRWESISINA